MKRIFYALMMSLSTLPALAWTWADWWSTADQQAQQLMHRGQFGEAKDKFSRDDWAAAAAYKSGDYQRAADLYKKMKSDKGFYNEGNALARMGQYERAIKAYDQALSLNPKDADAVHNRKLVSDLLKKEQKKNKEQQNKDQQNKDQQNKDQQNKEQQNKEQQNKEQQNKEQQNKEQQNKEQQNKEQQNKEQQNKEQQNKEQQNKEQQNKEQQNKEQQNKEQQNKEQQNKEQQNKEQQNREQQNKEQQNKKNEIKQQEKASKEADKEQQQANEQWLRLIPDDPGGLLREKFLRDHLRREKEWP